MVVREYNIERDLIDAFLRSMEMDLTSMTMTPWLLRVHLWFGRSSGLMCLRVFCEGDCTEFDRLREPARKLGSAFQKVNFLRDIKSDYQERGRTYFPGVDFTDFSRDAKQLIEEDIQRDFDEAYQGILGLPKGARMGVHLAYIYYLKLFCKIKNVPASRIQQERVRVPDPQKIALLAQTMLRYRLNLL